MAENLNIVDDYKLQAQVIKHLTEDVKRHSTGLIPIDEYYQVIKGNCTDITGYPYSGKTLLLIEILFNLSVKYGWKHLLHLPDSGKPSEIIAMLIHKKTGKSFNIKHHNAITEPEIIKCFSWIAEHFKILEYAKRPTPIEFWQYAADLDVDSACIDSWNYMRHTSSGTDYLAEVLSERNELAEKCNKHFFTVIHPRNPNANDYDKQGTLKAPDVFNLMGGSEWNNNGKNIIVVHKERKEGEDYDVYLRKIKPRIVGKTGFVNLKYDIINQKFYDEMLSYKRYANDNVIRPTEEAQADEFFGKPIEIDL